MHNWKKTSLLSAICICCLFATAQTDTSAKENSSYISITAVTGGEAFFAHSVTGPLTVTFPYRVINANGVATDAVFHSRVIRPFSPFKVFLTPIALEIGNQNGFVLARFSPVLMGDGGKDAGYRYSLGYGRIFYIGRSFSKSKWGKSLLIKPSVQIEHIFYTGRGDGSNLYLGVINNQRKTILVDGVSAGPAYRYKTYPDGDFLSGATAVDSVKSLDVSFGQRQWMFQPKVTISNNPYQHLCHWEVYVGYTLPFSRQGVIDLVDDGNHRVAAMDMGDAAFTVQRNGEVIRKTPYSLSGLNIGITVGFNLSHLLWERWRSK